MSEFGAVPDDLDYEFNPCRRPTEEEKKTILQQTSTAVAAMFNAGIISHKIALTELRESSDATGMWSSITDEDIAQADNNFGMSGEAPLPPMPGFSDYNAVDDNICTDKDKECKAKDPSKCPIHGSGGNSESEGKSKNEKAEVNGVTSHKEPNSEQQKKIDSVHIDFGQDNILPELNVEDLEELKKVSKPVLLKKGVIERNQTRHPEIPTGEYDYLIGQALYNSNFSFPGHKDGYINFVSKLPDERNSLVLVEMSETKNNFEIVHLIRLNDRNLKRMKGKS